MKLLYVFFILLSTILDGSSIYDINVRSLDGNNVSLSWYSGKMIMIVPFNAGLQNNRELDSLNAINQKNSDSLVVIAVPALEYDSTVAISELQQRIKSDSLSILVTEPVFVKKTSGAKQDPLFKWLTHVDENTHFDGDVSEGQYFVVSSDGVLYAVMTKDASSSLVNDVIDNQYEEPEAQ